MLERKNKTREKAERQDLKEKREFFSFVITVIKKSIIFPIFVH